MWWEGGGEFYAPTWSDLTWCATYGKIVLNFIVFRLYKSKKCMNSIMKTSHGCTKSQIASHKKKENNLMWVKKTASCMILDLPKFQLTSCQESACGTLFSWQNKKERSTAFLRASSTAGSCGMSSFFYIWIHVVTPPFALDTQKKFILLLRATNNLNEWYYSMCTTIDQHNDLFPCFLNFGHS